MRKVDLSDQVWTQEKAVEYGLDVQDETLLSRFPQMQDHKARALAMAGPLPQGD